MNRMTSTKPPPIGERKRLNWTPTEVVKPSALEMEEFASQFTPEEWSHLCNDRSFLALIDQDLVEAGALAASRLDRCVIIFKVEK
jgi:hypothetical protein